MRFRFDSVQITGLYRTVAQYLSDYTFSGFELCVLQTNRSKDLHITMHGLLSLLRGVHCFDTHHGMLPLGGII